MIGNSTAMTDRKRKYKLKEGVADEVIRGASRPPEGADDLIQKEHFGEFHNETDLNSSDDEEGANEGLGDGNIGRTTRNTDE